MEKVIVTQYHPHWIMLHFIELPSVSSEVHQFQHKRTKGSVGNITKAINFIIITKTFKRTSQETRK